MGDIADASVVVGGGTVTGGRLLLRRVITAAVAVPALVWVVAGAPSWMFQLLVVAASAISCRELARMFAHAGRPVYRRLGVAAGAALTASFAVPAYSVESSAPSMLGGSAPVVVLTAAVLLILSAPLWSGTVPATEPAANTLLGVGYVGWLLGYAIALHAGAAGPTWILFLLTVTWIGESAAYLVGSAFGRHRLAPVISPRKTVEGAVAQVLGSVVTAGAFGAWLLPECAPAAVVGAGAVLGVVGQFGDLAESAIKRSVGTKDTGGLIPGHGGLLDRLDSLLFNLPALYFYTVYVGCGA